MSRSAPKGRENLIGAVGSHSGTILGVVDSRQGRGKPARHGKGRGVHSIQSNSVCSSLKNSEIIDNIGFIYPVNNSIHRIIVRTASGGGKLRVIPSFPDVYDVYTTINQADVGQPPRYGGAANIWLREYLRGHA